MAGSTVTSTLDIRLVDDVSANAERIAAELKKVEAEAKAIDGVLAKSGAGQKFGAGLKALGASATHVEAATKAWQDYAKAEGLAAERGSWTSQQVAGVKNWERVTVAGVRSVMTAERALEAERAKASAEHLRQVQADHRAQERLVEQRQHSVDHHGIRNYALQTAAMAVSAHGIMSVVEKVYEHGAEYQHRLVALQNAGRTPDEIASMQAASHASIIAAPTATLSENLEILNETVGAFGSVEHALEHLTFMNKAAATLHAVAGDKISDSAGAMGNKLARFFEMRGTAGNGEVFEREAAEMMKSMVFSGGNVNPSELLNFAQQAKSALQNYDIGFLSRIAPSLIGEVGGDRAGTQANAFNSVILGKANDAKQAASWKKFGLIDPTQMTGKGDQKTGWTGGAIYHTDDALKNPLEYGEKYLLPALKAKGVDVDNRLELTKVLGTLFRNINAAAFANELWQLQNRNRLHKDSDLIGRVDDYEAIYKRLLATDPTFAFKALGGAFENLMTTVSAPTMGTVARVFSGMAENLNELAVAAHDHPVAAVTTGLAAAAGSLYAAGRLSYGLINGFSGLATMGPAAGEMVAAGHEQLAAGRLQLTAAEAFRAGALANDVPGVVPGGGKKIAGKVEGAVVREGEALAEGAAEVAAGNRIASAVEGALKGGLKGGLAVEALEIAATAGVTLTAGTVALVGLSAAAIIGALEASTEPKHQAAKDPGFGNPFAPGAGIDYCDPKYRDPDSLSDEEKKDAAKPWWNRGGRGAHARGSLPAYRDTDQPGHEVQGPHGTSHYALEDRSGPKVAPYFSTAPLGPDGRINGFMPFGWIGDRVPVDPSTGSIFGLDRMPTNPNLYAPADVPLPPTVPANRPVGVEVPTPSSPLPRDSARYPVVPDPVPMNTVAPPPAAPLVPPSRAPEASGPPMPPIVPKVEPDSATDALFQLGSLATETGNTMQTALNVTASPIVDSGSIDAASAAVDALAAKLRAIGPLAAAAASAVASAAGGVPGAGAIRAASNRQFAGASQTG